MQLSFSFLGPNESDMSEQAWHWAQASTICLLVSAEPRGRGPQDPTSLSKRNPALKISELSVATSCLAGQNTVLNLFTHYGLYCNLPLALQSIRDSTAHQSSHCHSVRAKQPHEFTLPCTLAEFVVQARFRLKVRCNSGSENCKDNT